MAEKITAPFTMDQVVALQRWQDSDFVHPFTCGKRDNHPEIHGDRGILIPTVSGWICQCCDYTQDWAHAGMLQEPRGMSLEFMQSTRER